MSVDALQATTRALQRLLHEAVARQPPASGGALIGNADDWILVGALDKFDDTATQPVSLFLFHIEPNREMRNAPRQTPDGAGGVTRQEALPLDVRFLISVKREGSTADANELLRMGQILAMLQANPFLTGAALPEQEVRLSPEPYPMEELSRVWSLYPKANYQTSAVYLASPVFIDAAALIPGDLVATRRVDSGQSAERPNIFGRIEEGV